MIEFRRGLRVHRCGAGQIASLRMQDRDRGLNDSLVEKFLVASAALPDFFPCLVAFEEFALVEEVDPFLEELREWLLQHR